MSATNRSAEETSERAISVLIREMGFADTVRFIQRLSGGFGNYTEERRERFKDVTLEDIYRDLARAREAALAKANGIVRQIPSSWAARPFSQAPEFLSKRWSST